MPVTDTWRPKRPGPASDRDSVTRQTLRAGIRAPPPELGAPYHVSPTRMERARVSNHTLIMLPLKLPHRKRGSTTILLTATGVQEHDDVLYNYALYSCTIASIHATTGYRGNRQPDLTQLRFSQRYSGGQPREWPCFEQNKSTHHHLLGFSTLHTPQLSTPF